MRIVRCLAADLVGDVVALADDGWIDSNVFEIAANFTSKGRLFHAGAKLVRRQLASGTANIVNEAGSIGSNVNGIVSSDIVNVAAWSAVDIELSLDFSSKTTKNTFQ